MNSKEASGLFEKFEERDLDIAIFEHDVDAKGWAEKYRIGEIDLGPIFWPPALATLTPPRLAGVTGTAVNLIQPSVVICDTTMTPFASFDMRDTPARKPGLQLAFTASAYGISTPGTYVFTFFVESGGSVTLRAGGLQLPGLMLSGTGDIAGTGARTITLVYKNLAANQRVFVGLEQQAGGQWAWTRATIGFPPLVFEQVNP